MCKLCRAENDIDFFGALFGGGRRGRGYGGYGGLFGGYDDGYSVDRSNFAPVSNRALAAYEDAERAFHKFLVEADTSKGPVTEEIVKFHLVQDMRKKFNKYVKEYGCTATSRKLTREEQDKFNKARQSLMQYTSVRVTPQAQKDYLDKHPQLKKQKEAAQNKPAASSSAPAKGTTVAVTARVPLADTTRKRNIDDLEPVSPSVTAAKKMRV